MIKKSVKYIWYASALLLVLFALLLTTLRLLTPELSAKRLYFQQVASRLLRTPVQIGSVHAELRWFTPELVFDDVTLYDKSQRSALLQIKHVAITINLISSLIYQQVRPGTIMMDSAKLVVQHQADGQLVIAGFSALPDETPQDQNALLAWLENQRVLILKNIAITWYTRDHRVLQLQDVNLSLANYGQRHQVHGQFRLDQRYPSTFQVTGDLTGVAAKLSDWNGSVFLSANNIIVQQWLPELPLIPANIQRGIISGRFWLTLKQGQIVDVKSRLASKALVVSMKTKENSQLIPIDNVSADLNWQRDPLGWTLAATKVNMHYLHKKWPENQLWIHYQNQEPNKSVTLRAQYVNLTELQSVLEGWQLPKMSGDLSNLTVTLPSVPDSWEIKANVRQFGLPSIGDYPAFSGLSGKAIVNPHQGILDLNSEKITLGHSHWLKPLIVDKLQGHLEYRHTDANWQVSLKSLYLKLDPWLEFRGGFNWNNSKDNPKGQVDAVAGFFVTEAHSIFDYVPKQTLDPGLYEWLNRALSMQGKISGKLLLKGNLAQFPFVNNEGNFALNLNVQDINLNFHPAWPQLQHATGNVDLHNNQLTAHVNTAQLGRVWLGASDVAIPDLRLNKKIIHVATEVQSKLEDILPTLHGTPVDKQLQMLADVAPQGPVKLNLDLQIPLHQNTQTTVKGNLQLLNDQIQLAHWPVQVRGLAGSVRFTENSVVADDLTGWWDEQPIHAALSTTHPLQKDAATQIDVDVLMNDSHLHKLVDSHWLQALTGKTKVHLGLSLPHDHALPIALQLRSNGQGLTSTLPAPFQKASADLIKFILHATINKTHQQITAELENGKDQLLHFNKHGDDWQLHVDTTPAVGQITMQQGINPKFVAHFSKLAWQPQVGEGTHTQANGLDPSTLPALQIRIDHFAYAGRPFGTVSVNADKIQNGLKFTKLDLQTNGFALNATGLWQKLGVQQQSKLQGEASSEDLANTLKLFGVTPGVEAKRGYYRFNVHSNQPLTELALANLNGSIQIQLNEGRILHMNEKTENTLGLGKLLSVLSLQSLPTHLQRGFGDLSDSGFPFNSFTGEFRFTDGIAHTDTAELDGPIAYAKLNGKIGFKDKSYNIRVRVSPHFESTLPIVATLAGGPLAGAATYVASNLIAPSLRGVNHYDYILQGQWDAPIVKTA